MIAVDDLNDWIGCMGGHPQAITPNIDRLAQDGMLFLNNHCQAPICGPSRASVITGLHPTTTGIYLQIHDKNIKKANTAANKSTFLSDWFEQHGYKSIGAGKILHQGGRILFDEYGPGSSMGPKPKKKFKFEPKDTGFPPGTQTDWGAYPESDQSMPDVKTAAYAVKKLGEKHDKPFFMAIGFCRPHVPWYVPQKWFDMYQADKIQLPAYHPEDMDDVPDMGKRIAEVPMMPTTEWAIQNNEWNNIIHAYLACTTFADAQIGKVLNALCQSEYADNTIVVLWSDHGYHLGEKNRFAKQAIWERDTRTVLLIKSPDTIAGGKCEAPTQLLDIYPTLLDLCQLPTNPQAEGHSLKPLLQNPKADWKHLAVTSYGVGNFSIRDRTYRYIRYEDGSEELYNLKTDPNEWNNLAKLNQYTAVKGRFDQHIPKSQAPLSKVSYYNINAYWQSKVKAIQSRKE
ncbi:sulfatase [Verrucomicrobiaceae bacterium N1E253]|uniref:Sulfatase n=2 Tax=Oceaniferula marina TaxID=2748318 RepID=A0A851GFI8_9BACT|nr:sulfatase [Oceaniferula marina]